MPLFVLVFLFLPALLTAEPLFRAVSWGMAPDQVEITELSQAQVVRGQQEDDVAYLNYQVRFFDEEHQLQYGFENQELKQISLVWLGSGRDFRRRERPLRVAEAIFEQWKVKLNDQFGLGYTTDQKNLKKVEWKTSKELVELSVMNVGQLPLLKIRLKNIDSRLDGSKVDNKEIR